MLLIGMMTSLIVLHFVRIPNKFLSLLPASYLDARHCTCAYPYSSILSYSCMLHSLTYSHKHTHTHTHIHTHAHTHDDAHIHIYTHLFTYTHTLTHTHADSHIHTHTFTYTTQQYKTHAGNGSESPRRHIIQRNAGELRNCTGKRIPFFSRALVALSCLMSFAKYILRLVYHLGVPS